MVRDEQQPVLSLFVCGHCFTLQNCAVDDERVHFQFLVDCSTEQSSRNPLSLSARLWAAMEEETPRLAFGHLLDQDGCDEDEALTVDVMGAASGDSLCTVTLAAEDPVQSFKKKIAVTLNLPESDQILFLPTGQRLGAKRRLRSVLPSGRSASVSLVISRPSCRCCGVQDGLWGGGLN